MIQFTALQQKQLNNLNIQPAKVQSQIDSFKAGFPFLPITRAAIIGDGILRLSDAELAHFISLYEKEVLGKSVIKFVPASGAASRMFKELFSFVEGNKNRIDDNVYISKFINDLKSFAFYGLLKNRFAQKGDSLSELLEQHEYVKVIRELISANALNYGGLPKGLLNFHLYEKDARTPVEEHFAEGAMYAIGKGNAVNIHFTVAPEHQPLFEKKVAEVQSQFESEYGVVYNVTYSQQLKSTDTIAVTMDNEPFVEEDGSILFRPAGHGALLENLNELEADIIFVKNIDNVVPDRLKEVTVTYKKAIGGVLIETQQKTQKMLDMLLVDNTTETCMLAKTFVVDTLSIGLPLNFNTKPIDAQRDYLLTMLNRPIRVCGMVKNTGEPGGGPFFVSNSDGSTSLQIGESSQLDLNNAVIKGKLASATHFNPVDLVCGVTDAKGKPFDLLKYRDDETGFITTKSKNGRDLKAQELPGLWNGAMANWITLFVEVPLITFNPVKTVNDLLREEHQQRGVISS